MCESFDGRGQVSDGRGQVSDVDEFDPLRNSTPSLPPPSCVVTMETSSPQSKPRLPYNPPAPRGANPKGPSLIPFEKPVRPCLSETNISQLQLEHRLATPLGPSPLSSAQSQETLNDDCVIRRRSNIQDSTPSPGNLTPRFPRERPQGFHLMPSPSSEITNPFDKEGVVQEEVWRRKEAETEANFFLVNSFSELEMTPTATDRKDSSSSMKRTASLDHLDERRPDSYEVLDYKQRRLRKGSSITSSAANAVGGGGEPRPLPAPASVPKNMSQKSPHHVSAPAVSSHSVSGPQTKSNKFHVKKVSMYMYIHVHVFLLPLYMYSCVLVCHSLNLLVLLLLQWKEVLAVSGSQGTIQGYSY